MDHILATKELQVERKAFFVDYRENDRGQFLRISEDSHGRRNTIIVPASGLDEFLNALEELLQEVEGTNEAAGQDEAPGQDTSA